MVQSVTKQKLGTGAMRRDRTRFHIIKWRFAESETATPNTENPVPDKSKSAKPSIQVIERMMHLLDVLSEHATPATLKQLAAATKLHPSTAHRILGSGMQVVRAVGGRAPLHLTSVGKLFLSADDARTVRAYAARTGLAGHTGNSITELGRLERELALVRARGYARDNEELELGGRCIAAGIYDDQCKLVAGLSISAPADRIDESWAPKLRATAAEISAALGCPTAQASLQATGR